MPEAAIIRSLRERLPTAVFAPARRGKERPCNPRWRSLTREQSSSDDCQRDFDANPDVVLLTGDPSDDLHALVISDHEFACQVLALNPSLRDTAQLHDGERVVFLMRIVGDAPTTTPITRSTGEVLGSWRGNNSCVRVYSEGMDLALAGMPVDQRFADIAWPPDVLSPRIPGAVVPFLPAVVPRPVLVCSPRPASALVPQAVTADPTEKFGQPIHRKAPQTVALDEHALAGWFASQHPMLFEPGEKKFYLYNAQKGPYEEISSDNLKTKIAAFILAMGREMKLRELELLRTNAKLNSIVQHLKGITERRGAFDQKGPIKQIHLNNGVLLLQRDGTSAFVAFSPELIARVSIPVDYDPTATCPQFQGALLGGMLSGEDNDALQKYLGQVLFGENLIQRFVSIEGSGNDGKSQLVECISPFAGPGRVGQLRTAHLGSRFEVGRLRGCTLATGIDVPSNYLQQEGARTLKALIGGDRFTIELKGSNGRAQLLGDLNVVVTANAPLRVTTDGDERAWLRRLLVVRFHGPLPTRRIPKFGELLFETEGSGILNWLLEGWQKLANDIADIGDIRLTPLQRLIIQDRIVSTSNLPSFLGQMVDFADGSDLTSEEIFGAYDSFCSEHGLQKMLRIAVLRQLPELMSQQFCTGQSHSIQRPNCKSCRGYRNVGFKPAKAQAAVVDASKTKTDGVAA